MSEGVVVGVTCNLEASSPVKPLLKAFLGACMLRGRALVSLVKLVAMFNVIQNYDSRESNSVHNYVYKEHQNATSERRRVKNHDS